MHTYFKTYFQVLVAIFLELLAGGAAVVAVVFCSIGLADNVEVIQGTKFINIKL